MLREFRKTEVREDLRLYTRSYEEQILFEANLIKSWLKKNPIKRTYSKIVDKTVNGQTYHQMSLA